jgi:hypothetical protein
MSGEELFENLPEMAAPKVAAEVGAPRLRQPERGQIELRACDLDSLLAASHLVLSEVEGHGGCSKELAAIRLQLR